MNKNKDKPRKNTRAAHAAHIAREYRP